MTFKIKKYESIPQPKEEVIRYLKYFFLHISLLHEVHVCLNRWTKGDRETESILQNLAEFSYFFLVSIESFHFCCNKNGKVLSPLHSFDSLKV